MTNFERSNHGPGGDAQDRRINHQLRYLKKRDHRKKLAEIKAEAKKRAQEIEARLSQES